ncbi:thiopurine S-methyltransferase [Cognaticolwellia beringensis]|uniref:Thiopurine S-methyltransferase n=1 Tax=Cognaticolwellia beringensis TaxID=1967665 RepID=A0A222GB77_9GAMM|nr:thiopurine S-methyltransferase [Cognaticolwellia beringensis]ASP49156.1 thiopurine S-methyltransferase [Cognaticolwellia beringensis]
MDNSFWHKCWERNTLGFHQRDVHPLLSQYFEKLTLPSDRHVFVPLCGKTLDMAYLARFMQVTGNELSDIACKDFFLENNIEYQKQTLGAFEQFSCPQLVLLQGDFFKLSSKAIDSIDWIYDRAALIALPTAMQQQYVDHLRTFFSTQTRLFLVTVEFPKEQLNGPPFAVTESDVKSLFSGFNIEYVAKNEIKDKQFAQRTFEVDYLLEKLYIISLDN